MVEVHTLLLDPHSLVDGVASLAVSLTTFSDDSITVGDTISIDLGHEKGMKGLAYQNSEQSIVSKTQRQP